MAGCRRHRDLHLTELAGRRPSSTTSTRRSTPAGRTRASRKRRLPLTAGFEAGLKRLTTLAADRRVAIMCGEPMPWRCHRLLMRNTDRRGWSVVHW
ncbi:DUF488 family protein [Rhodococcus hoagii]|nr:DUF488 family protein [Prescottella equi]